MKDNTIIILVLLLIFFFGVAGAIVYFNVNSTKTTGLLGPNKDNNANPKPNETESSQGE